MSFGWEGRKTRLVPLDQERHFENCVRWLNDPEVTAWTLMGDFPLTRLAEKDYFERAAKGGPEPTLITLAIETLAEDEEEHVGLCGLHDISYRHGVATAGLIIGRPKLWNLGLGTDAFATLTRYALEVLGLRMVIAEAFGPNERSIRMQRRCGYIQVGCVPQRYWKRGGYCDELLFAITREQWRQHVMTEPAK